MSGRVLQSLILCFVGQNPLFYAGDEFVSMLKLVFQSSTGAGTANSRLTHVDLSGLGVAFDDAMFTTLANNNPSLRLLNIQNESLLCNVSPGCLLHVVDRCRQLKDIRVFHQTVNDEVLMAIARQHSNLEHLSILFRSESKYTEAQSSNAWREISHMLPALRVTLCFNHTCPLDRICDVMRPEIPVRELRMETFTHIIDELNQAAAIYSHTLERVVLYTHKSEQLDQALVSLATICVHLQSLLVHCSVSDSTAEKIFQLRPEIKQSHS